MAYLVIAWVKAQGGSLENRFLKVLLFREKGVEGGIWIWASCLLCVTDTRDEWIQRQETDKLPLQEGCTGRTAS